MDMKMILSVLRFTLKTFHEFLNLFEDAFRRESWDDFLLAFRLHAIDAIQFFEVIILRIPFNFVHPSCVRIISHLIHTKYWVREDINFGSSDLINSFAQ